MQLLSLRPTLLMTAFVVYSAVPTTSYADQKIIDVPISRALDLMIDWQAPQEWEILNYSETDLFAIYHLSEHPLSANDDSRVTLTLRHQAPDVPGKPSLTVIRAFADLAPNPTTLSQTAALIDNIAVWLTQQTQLPTQAAQHN